MSLKLAGELAPPYPKKSYSVSLEGELHEDVLLYLDIVGEQSEAKDSNLTVPTLIGMMVKKFMEEDRSFQKAKAKHLKDKDSPKSKTTKRDQGQPAQDAQQSIGSGQDFGSTSMPHQAING